MIDLFGFKERREHRERIAMYKEELISFLCATDLDRNDLKTGMPPLPVGFCWHISGVNKTSAGSFKYSRTVSVVSPDDEILFQRDSYIRDLSDPRGNNKNLLRACARVLLKSLVPEPEPKSGPKIVFEDWEGYYPPKKM